MTTFSRIVILSFSFLCLLSSFGWGNPENYPEVATLGHSHDVNAEFIRLDQLVEDIVARKKVLIVDVRSQEEYASQHIKGAISIPLRDIAANLALIPREGLVALY